MDNTKQFADSVYAELIEMKNIGISVPDRAFERTKDLEEMADYENMNVSDCADLLVSLGNH